jgi:hypothetical protein
MLSPSRAEVETVEISALSASLEEGDQVQLQATVRGPSGEALNDREVFWATENPQIARVSAAGLVSAVQVGQTRLAASSEGKHAVIQLQVVVPSVRTVRIAPDSLRVAVRTGPHPLSVSLLDKRNNPLQGRDVTWTSRTPAVATVNDAGVVTVERPGLAYVVATSEGVSDSIPVRVVSGPPAILEIRSQDPQSGVVGEPVSAPPRVLVLDSDRNVVVGQAVQWSVLSGGGSVAPPSSVTNNQGIATATWTLGSGVGTQQVRAAVSANLAAVFSATAAAGNVRRVVVQPDSAVIEAIGATAQFAASARDAFDNPIPGVNFLWTSLEPSVAVVDPNGSVEARSNGTARILAAVGQFTDTVTVRVRQRVASVVVEPATATILIGATQQFTALARDPRNVTVTDRPLTWSSGAPAVATVNAAGRATGVSAGSAQIRATVDGVVGTAALTVNPNVRSLTVNAAGDGNGTVTSNPAGINCTLSNGAATGACQANFNAGANVVLTASSAGGHTFDGWSGSCTGTAATCTVSMTEARTTTGRFVAPVTLTVSPAGTGNGTVTSNVGGINCAISNGAATGACQASVAIGTVVTLTATSATGGHTFTGWSGGGCSGGNTSCTVTMNQNRTTTATFTAPPVQRTLTVNAGGTGNGTVTSNPAGITCTISNGSATGTCSTTFVDGTSVTLTATPATGGHTFTGWSGGGCSGGNTSCTVTMNQNRTTTATFAAPVVRSLTVAGAGTGRGSVASNPAGITCTIAAGAATGTCQANFDDGASVTLTATPDSAHTFVGWTITGGGTCAGTGPCTVTMNAARTVTANFAAPAGGSSAAHYEPAVRVARMSTRAESGSQTRVSAP